MEPDFVTNTRKLVCPHFWHFIIQFVGFVYAPYLNIMSIQKDITGDTRLVQDGEVISSGIQELCPLKSHWLVSAVINYERQTGWCSQMKQNMFGCAAQPSNDAGKQKDNCPLRWLGKSF